MAVSHAHEAQTVDVIAEITGVLYLNEPTKVATQEEQLRLRSEGRTFQQWLTNGQPYVSVGRLVTEGELVAVIEVVLSDHKVRAPVTGRVVEICAQEGVLIKRGDPILRIQAGPVALYPGARLFEEACRQVLNGRDQTGDYFDDHVHARMQEQFTAEELGRLVPLIIQVACKLGRGGPTNQAIWHHMAGLWLVAHQVTYEEVVGILSEYCPGWQLVADDDLLYEAHGPEYATYQQELNDATKL